MLTSDVILKRLMNLHPKRIDLTLDRILMLLEKLGRPQQYLPPVIHIAGTNGKGSTLAYLQAMFEADGFLVHRYTSPHLIYFRERIILAGKCITEKALINLLIEVEEIQSNKPITLFEITTAAAFLAFSRIPADILLLETGLGGRLDATNVVTKPLLTLLSSISLDHREFLGCTLSAIAKEKVAIGRTDVPMISDKQSREVILVIHKYCQKHSIPLSILGKDWSYMIQKDNTFEISNKCNTLTLPTPSLLGYHQYNNAALSAVAGKYIQKEGIPLSDQAIVKGISCADWPGRMQLIQQGTITSLLPTDVYLWLDGGHNPAAAQALAGFLHQLNQVRLIIGMLQTKDCQKFLDILDPFLYNAQSVAIPNIAGSYTAKELADLRPDKVSANNNIKNAIKSASNNGGKNIVICGSLYLVGLVLYYNK